MRWQLCDTVPIDAEPEHLLALGSSLSSYLGEVLEVDHLFFTNQWRGVVLIKQEPQALRDEPPTTLKVLGIIQQCACSKEQPFKGAVMRLYLFTFIMIDCECEVIFLHSLKEPILWQLFRAQQWSEFRTVATVNVSEL